jgi:type IV secretion system protein VirB11
MNYVTPKPPQCSQNPQGSQPPTPSESDAMWAGLPTYMKQAATPIKQWLQSPDVIEIMCNRPGEIWIEERGVPHMVRHEVATLDTRAIVNLARIIAGITSQNVNEETPLLSAAMPNGERFQAVLSPVASMGGAFSIRKQVIADMSMDQYMALGGFDHVRIPGAEVAGKDYVTDTESGFLERLRDPSSAGRREALRFAVQNRMTMLIAGGTSSGKTTFFNGLLKDVPEWERIISIEDTRELKPPQPNYLSLVASKGGQGRARTTMQDCLEASLRLRPDRIFMGEVRGAEAFSFLQAINTGHPGSMSTLHADNPRGVYERLAMMAMQAGLGLTKAELLEFVRFVVPIIIQIGRDPQTGRRGVTEIYFNKWKA